MLPNLLRSHLSLQSKASWMTRMCLSSVSTSGFDYRISVARNHTNGSGSYLSASLASRNWFSSTRIDKDANIKSAQIVYIVGNMGTGKTFTGDYMQVIHGYHHIDGDIPLKHMTLVPQYKEMVERLFLEDDWVPYHSEIARLAVEATKEHDKIVVTHNTWKNEHRDHIINKLIEGGASEEQITLMLLTIDPKVKLRGVYHRTKRMAEQSGMTMTESCKEFMEFEGEMTEEKYVNMRLEAEVKENETFDDFHPKAIMVDSTSRDATRFDNIDEALGLTRPTDLTYDSICAKVQPLDVARDKKSMESGFLEAFAEVLAKAEAEKSSWK